jgi:uncharacterized membrane protein (DUF485 family)
VPTPEEYLEIQSSPEFAELRTKLRRFVFPMSAFFLIWYAIYVFLGAYAHGFMATKLWGNINVGLVIGLGQFVTTFVITGIYVRGSPTASSTPAPRRFARSGSQWKATSHDDIRRRGADGRRPAGQHRHLRPVRRHHAVHRHPGEPQKRHHHRILHRWPGVLRGAERHRDLG